MSATAATETATPMTRSRRPATILAHAGRDPKANHGMVNPPVADGVITGSALSHQIETVTATVYGQPADVLYAGTAPGLVAGVEPGQRAHPDGHSVRQRAYRYFRGHGPIAC